MAAVVYFQRMPPTIHPPTISPSFQSSIKMLCIGHRGACGYEPENTLRSMQRALDMGADGIEIDVHCLEGELVVIHDHSLDRTTDGSGLVRRHSLAQVRRLDAGKGERIPLLHEVLDAVNRRALVNIELKGSRTAVPVLEILRHYGPGTPGLRPLPDLLLPPDRTPFIARRRLPHRHSLWPLAASLPPPCPGALDAWSIHVPLDHATPSLISRVHADGRKLLVFTVNERPDMDRMQQIGVDGFFTDYPDRWTGKAKLSYIKPN